MTSTSNETKDVLDNPHANVLLPHDASRIVGLSPRGTAWDVFAEKRGSGVVQDEERYVDRLMMPVIEEMYLKRRGKVNPVSLNSGYVYIFSGYPYCATIADGTFCVSDNDCHGRPTKLIMYETSHTLDGWGEPWSADVPPQVLVEAHHRMLCLDLKEAEIACFFYFMASIRVYRLKYDETIGYALLVQEEQFWNECILTNTPPLPDFGHKSTLARLKQDFTFDTCKSITLGHDELGLARQYQDLGMQIKIAESQREEVQAKLLFLMGDSGKATLPDGTILTRKQVNRGEYTVKPTSYMQFLVKNPKMSKNKQREQAEKAKAGTTST